MHEEREKHPEHPVEVWAFDEHRLGLKPVLRRIWAKQGKRPVAVGTHKYEWVYLYGFVQPATGRVEWWIADGVNIALFQQILNAFARDTGAGSTKTVILVLDNAGWHASPQVVVPQGIRFCFLPPYTPELQPAERLWPLANEGVANVPFDTLGKIIEALSRRCSALADQPETLKAYTNFHWWPKNYSL